MAADTDKQWHLDKRIPIAMIVALFVQFASGVWYMSWLAAQVSTNTKEIVRVQSSISIFQARNSEVKERVIRIEEKLAAQHELLERIFNALEKR
jgi:hypothetical protein